MLKCYAWIRLVLFVFFTTSFNQNSLNNFDVDCFSTLPKGSRKWYHLSNVAPSLCQCELHGRKQLLNRPLVLYFLFQKRFFYKLCKQENNHFSDFVRTSALKKQGYITVTVFPRPSCKLKKYSVYLWRKLSQNLKIN